jgi:regulator of sigma E protease
VLSFIWWVGFNIYSDDNRIILASDYSLNSVSRQTPATVAGLKTGDRIIGINSEKVEKFQDILEKVSTTPNETLSLTVLRGQQQIQIPIVPELDLQTGAGRIGVYAWRDLVIDEIQEGSAADITGLRRGDRITVIEGQEVQHSIDLYQHLQGKPAVLRIRLLREGQYLERDMVLIYNDAGVAELGLSFQVGVFRAQAPFFQAAAEGLKETGKTMVLTVKGIGLLFQGVNVRNAVAGPLRITYYVGSVARSGFRLGFSEGMVSYFRFLCLLSVILFVMNLLPIPALDGGQILIFVIEAVRRKRVNPRLIARIQTIGFSVLILLAVFITFSDVLFFMGR